MERPGDLDAAALQRALGRFMARHLDGSTAALEQDRLGFHVRLFADPDDRRFVTRLVREVLLTVVGAVTGVMATVLLTTSGGPDVTESVTLLHLIGYHLLVVSALVLLRVVATIARRPG